ncbi:hypothetical protein PAHAL_3G171300 [Panicum hallii]|jgi:hypothetical protein|uniref:Uncharacterized protein n=1 Tax=Panicum hallii TaxID=206008 RepID=A0A2T8KIG8_9POAL|nr:hypothetical protein PAHAL_3G171300 [Panicum hallii]
MSYVWYRSSTSCTTISSSRWTMQEAASEKEEAGKLQQVLNCSSSVQVGVDDAAGSCESISGGTDWTSGERLNLWSLRIDLRRVARTPAAANRADRPPAAPI